MSGGLYDQYLGLLLRGEYPEVEDFLAGQGEVSEELRLRLEQLRATAIRTAGKLPFPKLGPYRLLENLDQGGMGLVFRAIHERLGREVALKILRPELAASGVAVERFHREAQSIAKLQHPNIVTVFDAGEHQGVVYLAMEFVPGRTLAEVLREDADSLPLAQKVKWIRDLARALACAHAAGVVHRDVKPSNVRITPDQRAMLLDFGLVRSLRSEEVTLTDGFAGSPSYASPEQVSHDLEIHDRTDVYSLGVTLYECLTLRKAFEGPTVESLFHKILTGDFIPPRKVNKSLPRDLEIVVLKAMETEPKRRYGDAEAFAEDLDAVLELRPIAGRPPGLVTRLRKFAQRRPALAASVLVTALALTAMLVLLLQQSQQQAERIRGEAIAARDRASRLVAEYARQRTNFRELDHAIGHLQERMTYQHLTREDYAQLDRKEKEVEISRQQQGLMFSEILQLLRQAERIWPEIDGTETVRAALYQEKLTDALDSRDLLAAEFYRNLIQEHDPSRQSNQGHESVSGTTPIQVESEPPGAEVHLFQYRELSEVYPGTNRRYAAFPHRGEPVLPAGTFCLQVMETHPPVQIGDLIVELAGQPIEDLVLTRSASGEFQPLSFPDGRPVRNGFEMRKVLAENPTLWAALPEDAVRENHRLPIPALLVRGNELLQAELAPGTETRTTAAPIFFSPETAVGQTPLQLALHEGAHFIVLKKEGFEDLIVPLNPLVERGRRARMLRLLPLGETPPGFVRVPRYGDLRAFWIMETEVTSGEYLEFLNDPATLAEIDASPVPIRSPRPFPLRQEGTWPRGADGRFSLPQGLPENYPVMGVSWYDAEAYASWYEKRARAGGSKLHFSLPNYDEWTYAGKGWWAFKYPYGTQYRARYAHTCFAWPEAEPGPVREFPIDRSVFGVYDTCGGAFEWLDAWWDPSRTKRRTAGGAWAHAEPEVGRVEGGMGMSPDKTGNEEGFRLVARSEEDRP
ncbi:MAG: PEGA domain-containing protein [Planctomycetota bacterium]|nr:MAG: PEGA domain-containing protein [Planctomycetota bacterium]